MGVPRQTARTAASAACASAVTATNPLGWSVNSPVEVRNLTAATAPAFAESVGRMAEQSGRAGAMNSHGCGKMLFARVELRPLASRFGKVVPVSGL